jgi:hypothetical protein
MAAGSSASSSLINHATLLRWIASVGCVWGADGAQFHEAAWTVGAVPEALSVRWVLVYSSRSVWAYQELLRVSIGRQQTR